MAMMSRLKLVDQERKEVLEHNRRFGVYNAENKKEVPPKYPIEAMLEIATDAGCNTNQQNNRAYCSLHGRRCRCREWCQGKEIGWGGG